MHPDLSCCFNAILGSGSIGLVGTLKDQLLVCSFRAGLLIDRPIFPYSALSSTIGRCRCRCVEFGVHVIRHPQWKFVVLPHIFVPQSSSFCGHVLIQELEDSVGSLVLWVRTLLLSNDNRQLFYLHMCQFTGIQDPVLLAFAFIHTGLSEESLIQFRGVLLLTKGWPEG